MTPYGATIHHAMEDQSGLSLWHSTPRCCGGQALTHPTCDVSSNGSTTLWYCIQFHKQLKTIRGQSSWFQKIMIRCSKQNAQAVLFKLVQFCHHALKKTGNWAPFPCKWITVVSEMPIVSILHPKVTVQGIRCYSFRWSMKKIHQMIILPYWQSN